MTRRGWIVLTCGIGSLGFAFGFQVGSIPYREMTTSRLSPDETLRAWLVEWGTNPRTQRKFSVGIDDLAANRVKAMLLDSPPDEGGPPGTERLIWSRDGSKILLVGRHFFVRDALLLDGGDQAYFLHDLRSGRSWLNSASEQGLPALTADLIAGVEFTEPVVLKPRAQVDPDSPRKSE